MFTILLGVLTGIMCMAFCAPGGSVTSAPIAFGGVIGFMFGNVVAFLLEKLAPYAIVKRGTYPLVKFTHSVTDEQVFLEHYEGARTPPFWRHSFMSDRGKEENSVPCGCCTVRYNDFVNANVTIYDRTIDPVWKHFVISLGLRNESCVFIIPRGSAPDAESESLRIRKLGVVNA